MTGRRRAKRDGNPTAAPLGASVDAKVRFVHQVLHVNESTEQDLSQFDPLKKVSALTDLPIGFFRSALTTPLIRIKVSGGYHGNKLKRKNYYLDEKKIRRVRSILGAKTETEAIDAALDLVVFRKDILKSLEKVAGKGGVEKVF